MAIEFTTTEMPGTYVCHSDSGKTYRVHIGQPGDMCTCPGFQHNQFRAAFARRGYCRHIKAAREQALPERVYTYGTVAS